MSEVSKINGYDIKDKQARTDISNINIEKLRYEYSQNYHIIDLPENLGIFFNRLSLYESYDKKDYKSYIDESLLKNSGGNTIYVDKSNTQSPTAGTEANPYKNLTHAFQYSSDGDTIIVKKGIYNINDLPNDPGLRKNNVNIICDPGTLFIGGTTLSWSQNETYTNVYQASRTNVAYAIDIRNRENGIFTKLTERYSLESVANNKGSFYKDGTNVYVNIDEEVNDNKVAVCIVLNYIPFNMYAFDKDMKVYIENATFLHSTGRPLIRAGGSASYNCEFNAKNCKFLFGGGNGWGSMVLADGNATYINCEASFNKDSDGFTCHSDNGRACNVIELNCKGSYNGLLNTSGDLANSSNGSTSHDGAHVIRINGTYFNNKGGNVADVGTGTITLNYNCKAWDSLSSVEDYHKIDFGIQSTGTKMYLYTCFAKGNSKYNIYCYNGSSVINVYNCIYDTLGEDGTINIVE